MIGNQPAIVDVNRLRPHFAVIDGMWGLRCGPVFGTPVG